MEDDKLVNDKLTKDNTKLKKLVIMYEKQIKKMELKLREAARKDRRQTQELTQMKLTIGRLQSTIRNM